jgi:AcrR family transcriptional regulator
MGTARQDLLDRTITHVGEHGLSDLSLRELAAGIGSSHRMLIYHFGNREGLLAAIVASIETDQRALLAQLAADASSPTDLVRAQWAVLTDPVLRPSIVLFFEVLALALQERPGTEGFLAGLTEPWLDVGLDVATQLGLETSRDELRLGVAVMRGLLIELLAGADLAACTASLDRFLAMWEQA